ncbi:Tfp pilus assembly protein PilO [Catenuloplanes nepalensis]|uniref:Tfp pilus assembly protein PilO n=1 Tax=Catenuloplanes nepalensis TaxID=587533 RepID=A0ABT9MW23_9ACTN|nr:type II secretion system protein GspM [Catenuloplanes nepalensis]MDP9795644.1 Tfp pilus assembly protein PilO [Catenuloplanes nepalensis]
MRVQHVDRWWIAGGVVATVLLLVLTWFLLISPASAERESLRADTEAAATQLAAEQATLDELNAASAKKDQYDTELAEAQRALPGRSGSSELMRQIKAQAEAAKVNVETLTVGTGVAIEDTTPPVFQLPITAIVAGDTGNIEKFVQSLQQSGDRALLISSSTVNANGGGTIGGDADGARMTLSISAFVQQDDKKSEDPDDTAATN